MLEQGMTHSGEEPNSIVVDDGLSGFMGAFDEYEDQLLESSTIPQQTTYRAAMQTTDWYVQANQQASMDKSENNALKWELDHLYLKRCYIKIIVVVFRGMGLTLDHLHCNENELEENWQLVEEICNRETAQQFIKKFLSEKIPIVIRREKLDTFLRSLLKLSSKIVQHTSDNQSMENLSLGKRLLENLLIYFNLVESEVILKTSNQAKTQRFSRSHKASLLAFIWESSASIRLQIAKNYESVFTNPNEGRVLVTTAISLLQQALHCKESLMFLLMEEGGKQIKKLETTEGLDLTFRYTLVDTTYQTKLRSSTTWKILSDCYDYLKIELCTSKCSYFARSLTRFKSLFSSLASEQRTYSKEKINIFPEEEIADIDKCFLPQQYIIDEQVGSLTSTQEVIGFDRDFVEIYIFNPKTIHTLLSEQRGLSSEVSDDSAVLKRDDGDEDAPRTFDASQL